MTKPASSRMLPVTSALPVIVWCALVGATEARAVTCSADPSTCDRYVVSLQEVGFKVVAAGGGELETTVQCLLYRPPPRVLSPKNTKHTKDTKHTKSAKHTKYTTHD